MSGNPPKPAWGASNKPSALFKAAGADAKPKQPGPPAPSPGRRTTSSGSRGSGSSSGGRGGGGGGRGGGGGGRNAGSGRGESGGRGGGGRGGGGGNEGGGRGGGGGRGRGRGGGGNNPNSRGGGGGGGRHHNNNNSQQQPNKKGQGSPQQPDQQAQQSQQQKVPLTPWDEIVLLNSKGHGNNDQDKEVARFSAATFMACRMEYLDPPPQKTHREIKRAAKKGEGKAEEEAKDADENDETFYWLPLDRCTYQVKNLPSQPQEMERIARIETEMNVLWHFKPLEVNHETRWKGKDKQSNEAIGILNKLSWTNIDKMTAAFLQMLGVASSRDKEAAAVVDKKLIHDNLTLIVDKAMEEPHFAALYAKFSASVVAVHKVFKRMLLAICQEQFEDKDSIPGGDESKEGDNDEAKKASSDEAKKEEPQEGDKPVVETNEYKAAQAKKKYIGLMQFIGELYKLSVIKGHIMIWCLEKLFVKADEEKLECFAKLMGTIGDKLDHEQEASDHDHLEHMWDDVNCMAGRGPPNKEGPKAPSNRIKFLLQDLIDLRLNHWILSERQQQEQAKTIAQIHKEAEEEAQRRPSTPQSKAKMIRSQSTGASLSGSRSSQALTPDADGFQQVKLTPKKAGPLRRVQSDVVAPGNDGSSSLERALAGKSPVASRKTVAGKVPPEDLAPPLSKYLSPDECKKKMENLLKEYFVGGDTADAVLTVGELVGYSNDAADSEKEAATARGAAMVAAGILFVLERAETDVTKFANVIRESISGTKLPPPSLALGLAVPLELLRDVEIDAPKAGLYLAGMIAEWTQAHWLDFELFLQAPEYFKSDCRPADFCKLVLKQITEKHGGQISEKQVEVVQQLMTADERSAHPDARAWLEQ